MVLVDVFNEGLDTGFFNKFLLAVSPLDLGDVTGDACNKQVWESMFL